MRYLIRAFFALCLLLCLNAARADLQIALDPNIQFYTLDNPVEPIFSGALTSTDLSQDLLLNDIQFSFDGPASAYLTEDKNVFFSNVNGVLGASNNGSYVGPIFGVNVDPSTPEGYYYGSVTIQGGADPFALDTLATANFVVAVVPEPGALLVGASGLLCGMGALRRRRR